MQTDRELIQKYNVPGPRYTSYPTAVQFQEIDNPANVVHTLKKRNSEPRNVSLYFHVPFCFSLCWYCGCTKIITKNTDRGDVYIDYLVKEMDLVKEQFHPQSKVIQLHMGGGTPTFLKPDQLRRLGSEIKKRFTYHPEIEFSVEIDPRTCSKEHVGALAEIGVNRASLGVQDTNEEVQKAIHRIQPFEQTEQVTRWLREAWINSINFDLIYGLPKQTLETFQQTLRDVQTLHPDRLAVYSYAHLPNLMPSQKLLNEDEFPSPDEKLSMLMLAINTLENDGYRYIGMDHFSKEGDELTKALEEGTLQRNFQGYSTHANTDMYALGMSGISMVDSIYYQNTKDLDAYYTELDDGSLPVVKQMMLREDDRIRRDWISRLMCKPNVHFTDFEQRWGVDPKEYFANEWNRLDELEEDELIIVLDNQIQITTRGRLFLRNIAMVFDAYLSPDKQTQRYSKTV
ncbi:oxygen-independent coproporphyrinogen III oxidase [Rhodohalobacter halophilus]|uniref:oxygen-independent coproporphyrinogen III oxidase n=1 Tax=Rhodohalobacter halophilus TaxID=1812810 RepID=UPI00083F96E7|nr:oxygen-independent coproporphyrinogen III oxidase [Rhodohalobacter halophilus]